MPTPTDLVTDLPADFEVFGQAVDSSMADLLGGTTGQILAKNSNTNMDFVWITNDVGDITAVTAGTGISGGGSSGAVTITNSMATEIDAKGDLIGGTGADTFARLAVGANGTVLTAASGETTGLKWVAPVAGMTQLATGTLSSTSVVLSSISQSYKHLKLDVLGATASASDYFAFRFNGLTGSNYINSVYGHAGATATNRGNTGDNAWIINSDTSTNYFFTNGYNHLSVFINDYTSTTALPLVKTEMSGQLPSGDYFTQNGVHSYKVSSAAIDSITIRSNGGMTFTGGTYILWGVN